MDKTKIGYIEISSGCLELFWKNNKDFVPIEIAPQLHTDTILFLCYCNEFRSLNDIELIPTYEVTIRKNEIREIING